MGGHEGRQAVIPLPYTFAITLTDQTGTQHRTSYGQWVMDGIMPDGLTYGDFHSQRAQWDANVTAAIYDPNWTALNARGGGTGGVAAVYQAPDRRLVTDAVKGAMAGLTGNTEGGDVAAYVELYMQESRRDFDNKSQSIDPMASVVEKIRSQEDYKTIHAARPESEDEASWIQSRHAKLIAAGVAPTLASDLARAQATAAASDPTLTRAAETAQFQSSGRMLASHKNRMRESIFTIASLV